MKSIDIRDLAISHYKKGKNPVEIEQILNKKVHLPTICRWIASFQDSGRVDPKYSPGRPRTAHCENDVSLF